MNRVLVRNARIWVSGEADRTWMLFDKTTGRVLKTGGANSGAPTDAHEVVDLKGARYEIMYLSSMLL